MANEPKFYYGRMEDPMYSGDHADPHTVHIFLADCEWSDSFWTGHRTGGYVLTQHDPDDDIVALCETRDKGPIQKLDPSEVRVVDICPECLLAGPNRILDILRKLDGRR